MPTPSIKGTGKEVSHENQSRSKLTASVGTKREVKGPSRLATAATRAWKALLAVSHGLSIKQAAEKYKLSYNYLWRRKAGKIDIDSKNGPSPTLTPAEEVAIAKHIKEMSLKGKPLKRSDIQNLLQKYLKQDKRKTPFKDDKPGRMWYKLFLNRHPEITEESPSPSIGTPDPPKTSRAKQALMEVRKGLRIKQAAQKYNLSYNYLRRRKTGEVNVDSRNGPTPAVTPAEEAAIAKCIIEISQRNAKPPGHTYVRDLIQRYLKLKSRKTLFRNSRPAYKWYIAFMKRHPEISQDCGSKSNPKKDSTTVLNTPMENDAKCLVKTLPMLAAYKKLKTIAETLESSTQATANVCIDQKSIKSGKWSLSKVSNAKQALLEVSQGLPIHQAALKYNLSYSYLHRRSTGAVDVESRNGPTPPVKPAEEALIAKYVREMSLKGMPLRPVEVRNVVQKYIKQEKIPNTFKDDKPGKTWYRAFKRRHLECENASPCSPGSSSADKVSSVKQALLEVNQGSSVQEAAKKYNLRYGYLRRRKRGEVNVDSRNGPSPVLMPAEEVAIVKQIKEMSHKVKRSDIQDLVQKYLKQEKRTTPFKDDRPGHQWYKLFMKRHPEIYDDVSHRKTVQTKNVRERNANGKRKSDIDKTNEEDCENMCPVCYVSYERDDIARTWIACDICNVWMHKECVPPANRPEDETTENFICHLCFVLYN